MRQNNLAEAFATPSVVPAERKRPDLRLIVTEDAPAEFCGPFLSVANKQYLAQMQMLREVQARGPWYNPNPAPRPRVFCE
jgi:hypothetical protein